MAETFEVQSLVDVVVTVNNRDAITRCVENWDEENRPSTTGDGWRDNLYDLRTEEDVIGHWVFNCLANGVEDIVRLDGWADMPEGTVTMYIDRRAGVETCDIRRAVDA